MIENIKKTKGFVETPTVIVDIMHFYLNLSDDEKLIDLTAGRGSLFKDHPPIKCFGVEIDTYNHSLLLEKGFKNIIKGDVFENHSKIEDDSMDALILNPPYGNKSVEIMKIALKKLKNGGRFAIINQFNYPTKFKGDICYFKENLNIESASIFDTELFKPFASVKTLLILGVKEPQKDIDVEVWGFDNDKIKVNKRSKFVDVKLLKPNEYIIKGNEFWQIINSIGIERDTKPTIEDFKKTIIEHMAFESGLPKKMIENPKLLGDALNYFVKKYIELNEIRRP